MSGERVTERVAGGGLGQSGLAHRLLHRPLDAIGIGILAGGPIRQRCPAQVPRQVPGVLPVDSFQMPLRLCPHRLWEHGHPVLAALAVADGDLVPLEVDALDPQPQTLQQAQARAVQAAVRIAPIAIPAPYAMHPRMSSR